MHIVFVWSLFFPTGMGNVEVLSLCLKIGDSLGWWSCSLIFNFWPGLWLHSESPLQWPANRPATVLVLLLYYCYVKSINMSYRQIVLWPGYRTISPLLLIPWWIRAFIIIQSELGFQLKSPPSCQTLQWDWESRQAIMLICPCIYDFRINMSLGCDDLIT